MNNLRGLHGDGRRRLGWRERSRVPGGRQEGTKWTIAAVTSTPNTAHIAHKYQAINLIGEKRRNKGIK